MCKKCNVCTTPLTSEIYRTAKMSISSLCELIPEASTVFYCEHCGHVLTSTLQDIDTYYAKNYQILIESEEEDQIVSFPDGRQRFRFELQANTFFNKLNIKKHAKILDYGCAKSTTLKKICEQRQDIIPHLFDVSERYISFWKAFVAQDNWATFETHSHWQSSFDVITSFFSLEHVSEPINMLHKVHALLKDEGIFYCVVPNMFCNKADFIVADHVNHFSEASLLYLLNHAGFEVINIDTDTHYGAFVIVAKKTNNAAMQASKDSLQNLHHHVMRTAQYWQNIAQNIRHFEQQHPSKNVAIYGSGFYGTFIASQLLHFENVQVFIDQNPFRQGLALLNKPIVSPENIPSDLDVIYVGLNPSIALKNIQSVTVLQQQQLQYYYL